MLLFVLAALHHRPHSFSYPWLPFQKLLLLLEFSSKSVSMASLLPSSVFALNRFSVTMLVVWTYLTVVGCSTCWKKTCLVEFIILWLVMYQTWHLLPGDLLSYSCQLICVVEYISEKWKSLEVAGWAFFSFEGISVKQMCFIRLSAITSGTTTIYQIVDDM